MIVLLSGDGKYYLDGKDLEHVFTEGRRLFSLLKEKKFEEFSLLLADLHEFVRKKGSPVEILKTADIIIPSVKSNPSLMNELFTL